MDIERKQTNDRPVQRRAASTSDRTQRTSSRATRSRSSQQAPRSSSGRQSDREGASAANRQAAQRRRRPEGQQGERRNRSAQGQSRQSERRKRPAGNSQQNAARRSRSGKGFQTGSSALRKEKAKQQAIAYSREGLNVAGGAAKKAGKAILSNRIATIIAIVLVVLAVGGIGDTIANWEKAYGNVSINGKSVAGMTKAEISNMLEGEYATQATGTTVTVYADEETMLHGTSETSEAERTAQAEEMSVEEADAAVKMWTTNIYDLGGSLPYEEAAEQALKTGREGGPFSRLGLFVFGQDIPFDVVFDKAKLDAFATGVDRSVGKLRVDATVAFEDGVAKPTEGQEGIMVDRAAFGKKISDALLGKSETTGFVAEPVPTASRTTYEQAREAADGINRTLAAGATFTYEDQSWTASAADLASWTKVEVVEDGDSYHLKAYIDEALAIPGVVNGVHANVTSEDVTVSINKIADQILVHTSGSGIIPEVAPAVAQLNSTLYGDDGRQWAAATVAEPYAFEITSSNAPGALTFDQACELGILTVIGEYTTEFSNYEGTENRNHNIMTAADLLDGSIVEADGGVWSFNDTSGDTTKDPPFASAGSIIDGEHVDSIGGGICQVATTVFNAVYEAGLPIVERHNHTEHMHSYPDGRDAAVSYGEWDLKWKNDLPSDIVLRLSYTDHSVTAKLYSVYTGRVVTFVQSEWTEGDTYTTKFEEDEWMYAGQYYTKTAGENGSSISVTRTVVDASGKELSHEIMNSVYSPKKEVIVVGPGTDTKPLEHKADNSSSDDGSGGYEA